MNIYCKQLNKWPKTTKNVQLINQETGMGGWIDGDVHRYNTAIQHQTKIERGSINETVEGKERV